MSAINCFRFVDDKVAEHWSEYDAMGMMQQLGVIPAPASA
jgi:predicted ester cyclase